MILGFVEAGPEQIVALLTKCHGVPASAIRVVAAGETLDSNVRQKHIVFMVFQDFEPHLCWLRNSRHMVYVFSTQFNLKRYKIGPIDVGVPVRDIDFTTVTTPVVSPSPKTEIDKLLHRVQQSSLWGDLMSIIYDLPSKSLQKPVTTLCCQYLVGQNDRAWFERELRLICKRPHLQPVVQQVCDQIDRPVTCRLRTALAQVAVGTSTELAAQANDVQEYEICYVLGNLAKKSGIVDDMVQNVGES